MTNNKERHMSDDESWKDWAQSWGQYLEALELGRIEEAV